MRLARAVVVALLVAVVLAVVFFEADTEPPRAPADGKEWYRDPQRPQANIPLFRETPSFAWFGTWAGPDRLRAYLDRATEGIEQAQVVLMNAEARECTGFAAARRWAQGAARAIGDRPVMIALEPDSLGTLHLIPRDRREACYRLIRDEVELFGSLKNAEVYVEAKRYRWDRPAETAAQLRRVGVCAADGVLVNATGMSWTEDNIDYAEAVDQRVPCRLRTLVNTSHNGRGPRADGEWCDRPPWHAGAGPTPRRLSHDVVLGYVNRPYTQKCWARSVRFDPGYANFMAERHTDQLGP